MVLKAEVVLHTPKIADFVGMVFVADACERRSGPAPLDGVE
jgi:hypothetical protein